MPFYKKFLNSSIIFLTTTAKDKRQNVKKFIAKIKDIFARLFKKEMV